jgi:hypothetical protein
MPINGAIEKIRSFKKVASSIGKLGACLILGAALLPQSARASYATTVLASNPVAFWQLNETANPANGGVQALDSSGHGFNGTYGIDSQNGFNGIFSPQPPTFPGFTTGQGALQTAVTDANTPVSVPLLNLNTNTVTIAMWINPNNVETAFTGLLMNRSAGDAAGFGFGGPVNAGGMAPLGYTWNNNAGATFNFNSGLYPVVNAWNFVALVIRTNSATIYLCVIDPNTGQTNILSAVNSITHNAESFAAGTMWLGSDVTGGGGPPDAGRIFSGSISDVAVYNTAFTSDQIVALYASGLGVAGFPPSITTQPQSRYLTAGSKAQFTAGGINGTSPFTYQWKLNGTNIAQLADAANFSGANSNTLTILSAANADAGSYLLYISNSIGYTISSNATVTIQATNLVGRWLDGSTAGNNLLDVSGYSLATNHGAYLVGGGNYMLTNDVPLNKTGQSIYLFNGDTGLVVSNSTTLDPGYDNTFDDRINNAITVTCWAKGWPGNWNPFVCKYGETTPSPFGGWQLRADAGNHPCWTLRGAGGTTNGVAQGTADGGNPDDLAASSLTFTAADNVWHFYAGTYDASTGLRRLYVDGVYVATETNLQPYTLASIERLCIGARDSGTAIANFFTGQLYDVRIYNYSLAGTALDTLYGQIPGSPSTQPKSITTFTNSVAAFSVTGAGTPPLTYQWRLNGTNINLLEDSTNFTGANGNVLTVLSATALDVGAYSVTVSNAYGGAVSTNANLTLVPKVLLGEWFTGASSLADVSGYQPPGTHDGYDLANGTLSYTNDVPPGKTGVSLVLANDGVGIMNSATVDGGYTNTFDETILNAMTVAFWAKGYPGQWNPWVSKYGDSGPQPTAGWQLRDGGNNNNPAWTIRGAGGTVTQGTAVFGNAEDMRGTIAANDGQWHHYAGTFNANTGERRLYIDGVLSGVETGNHTYTMAQDSHVCIGARDQHGAIVGYFTGRIFDVRIYNYNLNSNEVKVISSIPDPSVTGQPQSALAYIGGKTILSTIVKGTAPLTNHWQFGGTNLVDGSYNGTVVVGSTSNVLTLYNLNANFQGTYTLVVSNSAGMTTSSNAVLTIASTASIPGGSLVGAWLTGAASLAETSGYQPAGKHDAYGVTGTGVASTAYTFSSEVPPGLPAGNSLTLNGALAIAITNSSTLDAAYTNTFDDVIATNGMTVTIWAKGLPGQWNPWISKFGESGAGWQLRVDASANTPCWTLRATGGVEDMSSTRGRVDTNWHFYAGSYSPVTGNRTLYVDGVLAATQAGQGPFNGSPASHLTLGGRDGGGNLFGNYFSGKLYGARIYNTELSQAQINSLIPPSYPTPVFSKPIISGNQLVLQWSVGTLLQSTNVTGPYTPTAGATSPFTNDITTSGPQMFYRVTVP